jgi:hypothetical protein
MIISFYGKTMNTEQRAPIDLLDQMYTLAYWITGSLKKTNDLVYKTYEKLDSSPSVIVALKTQGRLL